MTIRNGREGMILKIDSLDSDYGITDLIIYICVISEDRKILCNI